MFRIEKDERMQYLKQETETQIFQLMVARYLVHAGNTRL